MRAVWTSILLVSGTTPDGITPPSRTWMEWKLMVNECSFRSKSCDSRICRRVYSCCCCCCFNYNIFCTNRFCTFSVMNILRLSHIYTIHITFEKCKLYLPHKMDQIFPLTICLEWASQEKSKVLTGFSWLLSRGKRWMIITGKSILNTTELIGLWTENYKWSSFCLAYFRQGFDVEVFLRQI